MTEHLCPDCNTYSECIADVNGHGCDDECLYPDTYPLHQCLDCFAKEEDFNPITHFGYDGAYNDYQIEQAKGFHDMSYIYNHWGARSDIEVNHNVS